MAPAVIFSAALVLLLLILLLKRWLPPMKMLCRGKTFSVRFGRHRGAPGVVLDLWDIYGPNVYFESSATVLDSKAAEGKACTLAGLRIVKPLMRAWFFVGYLVSVLIVLPSVALLTWNLAGTFSPAAVDHLPPNSTFGAAAAQGDSTRGGVLQVVIPGVNLPSGEIGCYLATLLACSVVHEAGHAMAALAEGVAVHGCGMTLICCLLPVAYVHLSTSDLEAASYRQKIRVYTGGVWHNLVLAALAGLALSLMPPQASRGVEVAGVAAGSPAGSGAVALAPGDLIFSVNNCSVDSTSTWFGCIKAASVNDWGWCSSPASSAPGNPPTVQSSSSNCCSAEEEARGNLCFEWSGARFGGHGKSPPRECRKARDLVKTGTVCSDDQDCLPTDDLAQGCSRPVFYGPGGVELAPETKLLQVKRRDGLLDFLYVGHPMEVYRDVQVLELGHYEGTMSKFLFYLVSFSAALAVLNIVPCYRLDGQYIVKAMVDEAFLQSQNFLKRNRVVNVVTFLGTSLIAANFVQGVLAAFSASIGSS